MGHIDATSPPPGALFVGQLMVELPADAWLPDGYSLTPPPSSRPAPPPPGFWVTDPAGQLRCIYPVPDFVPPKARQESIKQIIQDELRPFQTQTVWTPRARAFLGMDGPGPVKAFNRMFYGTADAVVNLLDLANYGIQAGLIVGTEGLRRAGVVDQTGAGELRRDGNLLMLVAAAEFPAKPGSVSAAAGDEAGAARMLAQAQTIQKRIAFTVGIGAQSLLLPIRIAPQSGYPFGRTFGVLEQLWADERGVVKIPGWGTGRAFDKERAGAYDLNEIYVTSSTSKSGYRRLDSYLIEARGPFQPGPVSRKTTQLADVSTKTVMRYLNEAHNKYRPGTIMASVRSTPFQLRATPLKGQLFLEVPVQTKPIPQELIQRAKALNIIIRDVSGKEY